MPLRTFDTKKKLDHYVSVNPPIFFPEWMWFFFPQYGTYYIYYIYQIWRRDNSMKPVQFTRYTFLNIPVMIKLIITCIWCLSGMYPGILNISETGYTIQYAKQLDVALMYMRKKNRLINQQWSDIERACLVFAYLPPSYNEQVSRFLWRHFNKTAQHSSQHAPHPVQMSFLAFPKIKNKFRNTLSKIKETLVSQLMTN